VNRLLATSHLDVWQLFVLPCSVDIFVLSWGQLHYMPCYTRKISRFVNVFELWPLSHLNNSF